MPASSGGSQSSSAASERFVRQIGDGGIEAAGEGGAAAQRPGGLAPRQQVEAVRADPFEQGGLDRGRIGAAVLAAGQQDRAEPAAVRGADGAGRGIERDLGAGRDPVGEQGFDRRLVDRRGGEDARARRGAAHLGDGEPVPRARAARPDRAGSRGRRR